MNINPLISKQFMLFGLMQLLALAPMAAQGHFVTGKRHDARPRFMLGIDTRNIWLDGKRHGPVGLFVGLNYKDQTRYRLIFSMLPKERILPSGEENTARSGQFGGLYLAQERDFYRLHKFVASTSVLGGGGRYFWYAVANGQTSNERQSHWFGALEGGLHLRYELWPWLDLKTGGGYRLVFPTSTHLNGPYLKVGIAVRIPKKEEKS